MKQQHSFQILIYIHTISYLFEITADDYEKVRFKPHFVCFQRYSSSCDKFYQEQKYNDFEYVPFYIVKCFPDNCNNHSQIYFVDQNQSLRNVTQIGDAVLFSSEVLWQIIEQQVRRISDNGIFDLNKLKNLNKQLKTDFLEIENKNKNEYDYLMDKNNNFNNKQQRIIQKIDKIGQKIDNISQQQQNQQKVFGILAALGVIFYILKQTFRKRRE